MTNFHFTFVFFFCRRRRRLYLFGMSMKVVGRIYKQSREREKKKEVAQTHTQQNVRTQTTDGRVFKSYNKTNTTLWWSSLIYTQRLKPYRKAGFLPSLNQQMVLFFLKKKKTKSEITSCCFLFFFSSATLSCLCCKTMFD